MKFVFDKKCPYICLQQTYSIMADGRSIFSAFRLKKETINCLQDLKKSFELSYGRDFSNDEFIHQLVASVEDGDVAVWEIFCKLQMTQKELAEMAAENRKQREQQIQK